MERQSSADCNVSYHTIHTSKKMQRVSQNVSLRDISQRKSSSSCCQNIKKCINRNLNVSRKEMLAASDVTIVTKKKLAIIAYTNLVSFLLELFSLFYLSYTDKLQAVQFIFFGKT